MPRHMRRENIRRTALNSSELRISFPIGLDNLWWQPCRLPGTTYRSRLPPQAGFYFRVFLLTFYFEE